MKKIFPILAITMAVSMLLINPASAKTIVVSKDYGDNPLILNSDMGGVVGIDFGQEVNSGSIEVVLNPVENPQFGFGFRGYSGSSIAMTDYGEQIISDNWRDGHTENDFFDNPTPIAINDWSKIVYSWSYDLNTRKGQHCLMLPNNEQYCSNSDFPIPFNSIEIGNPAESDLLVKSYVVFSDKSQPIIPVAAIVAPLSQAPATIFNDLLPLLVLIIGVPFGFWVVQKLTALAKKQFKS